MDRTQPTQKLRRWQELVSRFDQTIVHTAGKENYIVDALSGNDQRPSPSTKVEHYIPQRIDNTTLYRAPTHSRSTNTISCNHFSIRPLTLDMSEYQSCSASDVSYTDCEYSLRRTHAKATGHHPCCPYQDDEEWE